MFAGKMSDSIGRKKTMILSAILFTVSALGCALSSSLNQLVLYRIVGGIGIGIVSIVSPLYISEISPASHRGRMVILYQLAVTIGFLGAYLMNYFLLNFSENYTSQSELLSRIFGTEIWRGMLGAETLPAILFSIAIFFIPESPRWLILKGNEFGANRIFLKIYQDPSIIEFSINETKTMLLSETKSDWKMLFARGTFRAVLIGSAIALLGQFMGVNAVLYYEPSIFESNGLSSGDSLFYQSLIGLVNVCTTVLSLW
ncbi:hypothetical protein MASR2M117_21200 [Paludibacter sp.]